MTDKKTNLAASVAARLLNRAKQSGDDYQTLLTGYCLERFLYRLGTSASGTVSCSRVRCCFACGQIALRATRDLDLLHLGDGSRRRRSRRAMIEYKTGDVLGEDVEALVEHGQLRRVHGPRHRAAVQAARPGNSRAYAAAAGGRGAARTYARVRNTVRTNPRFVINFPTKRHWRGKSRIADIEAWVQSWLRSTRQRGIRSIAVPTAPRPDRGGTTRSLSSRDRGGGRGDHPELQR